MKEVIEKYLIKLNKPNISSLSDEQVKNFFVKGLGGKISTWSSLIALDAIKNNNISNEIVVNSMRKAMELKTNFICCFKDNESANIELYSHDKGGWFVKP